MFKHNRDINIWNIATNVFHLFKDVKLVISSFQLIWNLVHALIFSDAISKLIYLLIIT